MKKLLLYTSAFLFTLSIYGQEAEAVLNKKVTPIHLPSESFSISIKAKGIGLSEFSSDINSALGLNSNYQFNLLRSDEDVYGILHQRYSVGYSNRNIEGNQVVVHSKNGIIQSINGEILKINDLIDPTLTQEDIELVLIGLYPTISRYSTPKLTYLKNDKELILAYSVEIKIGSFSSMIVYIDCNTGELIKEVSNIRNAKANSTINGSVNINTVEYEGNYYLMDTVKNIHIRNGNNQLVSDEDNSWIEGTYLDKVSVYGVYADYNNGLGDLELWPDLYFKLYYEGAYAGYTSAVADNVDGYTDIYLNWPIDQPGSYTLKVYDEDPNNDDYLFSLDFYSRSNDLAYYNNLNGSFNLSFDNSENAIIDAYWATQNVYDLYNVLGWSGPDNDDGIVKTTYNLPIEIENVSENGQCNAFALTDDNVNYIYLGDGSCSNNHKAFVSQDVVGHEYTHLVINHSSQLDYEGESGAINEALSDIFGDLSERYAYNTNSLFYYDAPYTLPSFEFDEWLIGEDVFANGDYVRSFSNPKIKEQPDTYLGEYWIMYDDDHNGVHTNSGVYNYWYYLLIEGGSGVNDNGLAYDITPLEGAGALIIPQMSMLYYMTPNTNYLMAKDIALQICEDYPEEISQSDYFKVLDAWAAVGLGGNCTSSDANILVLHDSFGDGWQGNTLNIEVNNLDGENLIYPFTIEDGYSAINCLPNDPTTCLIFSWEDGDWTSECSWQIYDAEGNVLAEGSEGSTSEDYGCIAGCTDQDACNYVEDVNVDDGSCVYAIENFDCYGDCIDVDSDGICDIDEVLGCVEELACNYLPTATEDDGSCEFSEEFYNCFGQCNNDVDSDGVCDELEIVGCQDLLACNYIPNATDEGTCEYAQEYYNCEDECINDTDGDGVCNELEIIGCTDMGACNYNSLATDTDLYECEYLDFELNYSPNSFVVSSNDNVESALYTWYVNGTLLSGMSDNYLVAEENGIYELVIFDPINQCEAIESVEVYGVGLNEMNTMSFDLYPNPANNEVIVSFDWCVNERCDVEITNLLGESLRYFESFNKSEIRLALDGLQTGSYLVSLKIGGNAIVQPLSIMR